MPLAQFYVSCAQINVTGGGSGNPGPLVSIPGVYTGREPGIMLNIYYRESNDRENDFILTKFVTNSHPRHLRPTRTCKFYFSISSLHTFSPHI